MLASQAETPAHYQYLKEFRAEQCPSFLQRKCTEHKPYTCFYWHFPNQRRRRPILKRRDGIFNYSPFTYCTKYDEKTGSCPDGDGCPFLHKNAGDTERRYHLRNFRTCTCEHETDAKGFCAKNGAHCAFAHGEHDKRPAVYDLNELEQQTPRSTDVGTCEPSQLQEERKMIMDNPKWQDANYVVMKYKTDACKKPPRLCGYGFACPQYHYLKDRRRSPKKYKYRSTPCPHVKEGDEWGDPTQCEDGDDCTYCHTLTETLFHPDNYKSTKCHGVFTENYCPHGRFCAFAHADHEMSIRILPTDKSLEEILSNVLPPSSGAVSAASSGLSSTGSNPSESMDGSCNNGNGSSGAVKSCSGNGLAGLAEDSSELPPDILDLLRKAPLGSSYKASGNEPAFENPHGLFENIDNAFSRGFRMQPDLDYSPFPFAGFRHSNQNREDSPGVLGVVASGSLPESPVSSSTTSTSLTDGMNGLMGVITRPDLCYHNVATLQHFQMQMKNAMDTLSKAIGTLSDKDSANYSCLLCKQKDKPRTTVLLPCDHQVLCNDCYAVAGNCPLCGTAILTRKVANQLPTDFLRSPYWLSSTLSIPSPVEQRHSSLPAAEEEYIFRNSLLFSPFH